MPATEECFLEKLLAKITPRRKEQSQLTGAHRELERLLHRMFPAGALLGVDPSGSYAKGTALAQAADLDLLLSFSSATAGTIHDLFEHVVELLRRAKLRPRRQTVSVRVIYSGLKVDLVPGKRPSQHGRHHWLHWDGTGGSRIKTNVQLHINDVLQSGRQPAIRLMKHWRTLNRLAIGSFLMERIVLEALHYRRHDSLELSVLHVMEWIESCIETARVIDPANSANVLSEQLTRAQKKRAAQLASRALDDGVRTAFGSD